MSAPLLWFVVDLSRQNSQVYLEGMSACHQRAADSMVEGAVQNGGLYIKLGQGLCAFNHLLPPEYIRTLRILEDKALNRRYKEVSTSLQWCLVEHLLPGGAGVLLSPDKNAAKCLFEQTQLCTDQCYSHKRG